MNYIFQSQNEFYFKQFSLAYKNSFIYTIQFSISTQFKYQNSFIASNSS